MRSRLPKAAWASLLAVLPDLTRLVEEAYFFGIYMYIHVYGEAIVEPKLVDMPTQNPKSEARIPKQIQTAKSQ
jgi:hypothetical protein